MHAIPQTPYQVMQNTQCTLHLHVHVPCVAVLVLCTDVHVCVCIVMAVYQAVVVACAAFNGSVGITAN